MGNLYLLLDIIKYMKFCLYARNKNQEILFRKICKILKTSGHEADLLVPKKGKNNEGVFYPEEMASKLIENRGIDYPQEFARICKQYNNINRIIQSDRELNYFPEYFGDKPVSREVKLKYLVVFFLVFESYIDTQKPNCIIAEMVLGLMDGIFYEVCNVNGITYLGIRPSKTSSGIVFCDTPFDEPIGLSEKIKNISGPNNLLVSKALDISNRVVKRGEDPHYMIRSARKHRIFTLRAFNAGLRILFDNTKFPIHSIYQRKKLNAFREVFWKYRNIRGWSFDDGIEIDQYCQSQFVFAAHFEPEASVHVRAYDFSDQLGLIKLISRLLPPNSILIVKDHKGNQGFRKATFYKQISHLYNVKIVSPSVNLRSLIQSSNGVITLTGRIGLESLIDGVPVIAFGDSFWTNLRHVYKPRSIDDIKSVLSRLSKEQSVAQSAVTAQGKDLDIDLAKLIIAYETSVYPGSFIQGDKLFISDQNAYNYASAILNISNKFL